ncbi:DUF1173 family protein, partial [Burkholderia cenocepacia]|uniref:DUF1173 family protein n=1 Tax=Burkholderia cenocepacia TaxID=95486 RepID=UPI0006678EA0
GDVEGSAIVEDPESGEVTLKFGFALAKGASREMPEPSGDEPDSIKTDGKKLTLRGLLHYLWEQAGLNRWSPAMAGKRNWSVVRKYLLLAVAGKNAKKMSLEDMLYVPEMFVGDQKDRIAQRRTEHLARISVSESGKPHFVLVIGELKEIATARFGFKLVIKHLPDYGLMVDVSSGYQSELDTLIAESELDSWIWRPGTEVMPPLPLTAFDAARKAQRQPRPLASAAATNALAVPGSAIARELENRTRTVVKAPETEPDPTPLFAEPPVVDEPPPRFDDQPPYTDEDRPANWL